MAIVYVPHPVQDDISSARQWGALKYVTERYIYPDEIDDDNQIPAAFQSRLAAAVDKFRPEDFLLIVGDHLQLVCLSAMIGRAIGPFQVLRYVKSANGYVPVRLSVQY